MSADTAYLGDNTPIRIPDVRICEDDPTYVYHSCRGYSASVAVEDIDGRIVGWMHVDDLPGGPYDGVRAWMEAVGYIS